MSWWTVNKKTVSDAFFSKRSTSALLGHEQQTAQKWCLSIRHSTACGDYNENVYENTSNVCKTHKCWKMTYQKPFNFNSAVVST